MEDKKIIQNEKISQEKLQLKKWHIPKLYDLETIQTEYGSGGSRADATNSSPTGTRS